MRLLFLTPQLPYPTDKGTRIRNFGLIRELGRRGHDVGVVTFGDPSAERDIAALARHCRVISVVRPPRRSVLDRLWRLGVDPAPDLARRLWCDEMVVQLRAALAEQWDIVQIEGLEMAPFWLASRDAVRAPVVLDAHNVEWLLQQRHTGPDLRALRLHGVLYSWIQTAKLRRYEARAADFADAVICVSTDDRAALARIANPRHVAIVPNGLDTHTIAPRGDEPDGDELLFTGTMDYRPNVDAVRWFVRAVWPLVRAQRPTATFAIVGRAPAPAVRALAREDGVIVTGEVTEVAPWFRRAAVYVAPLRIGGGMRLKILEAFAYGVPVVATTTGAEGVDLADGREGLLANEPASLAAAIVQLLASPSQRRSIAIAARALVERRYDWRALTPTLERLYETLAPCVGSVESRSTVAGSA